MSTSELKEGIDCGRCLHIACDISKEGAAQEIFSSIPSEFRSIDVLVNKARLIYLMVSLARLLAKDGRTVNAVSPGRTHNDMTGPVIGDDGGEVIF